MASRDAQVVAAAIKVAGQIISPTVRDSGYFSTMEATEYGKRVGVVANAILREISGGAR